MVQRIRGFIGFRFYFTIYEMTLKQFIVGRYLIYSKRPRNDRISDILS